MELIKIELDKINLYDFEGKVIINGFKHECYGEFNVYFDDDIAIAEIDAVNVKVQGHWVKMNLRLIDTCETEEELSQYEKNYSEWYADFESSRIDYIYDNYQDELRGE